MNESQFLEIDQNASHQKKIQRIEHILINYFRDGFALKLIKCNRDTCLWDRDGRVRSDKRIKLKSDLNVRGSRGHAAIWTILFFIYEREQHKETRLIPIRGVFYRLKHAESIFSSPNAVHRILCRLVAKKTSYFTKKLVILQKKLVILQKK